MKKDLKNRFSYYQVMDYYHMQGKIITIPFHVLEKCHVMNEKRIFRIKIKIIKTVVFEIEKCPYEVKGYLWAFLRNFF